MYAYTGADLGFYKGGCPIQLKGSPGVERRRRRGTWGLRRVCASSQKIFVFFISKWWAVMHFRWYLLTLLLSKRAP